MIENKILDDFDNHLRVALGLVPSSAKAYRRHVTEFFTWRDGNAGEGPVSRQEIEGYLTWCFRRGNGNATRKTKTVALQNFFRFCIYSGIRPDDPTAMLPALRTTRPHMLTFNRNEILRMFRAIDITTEKGLRDVVFLVLGAFAGFRVSEISGFNIEQISDDGKDITLVIPKSKRGAGREVYLWKAPGFFIRELFIKRISAGARTGDPLLVRISQGDRPRNRRLTSQGLERLLKDLCQRAGIRKPAVKTHMLRATHANDLQHVRGYTLPAIMERLGWVNLETAARYLVHRERIHKEYRSLHEYWIDFTRVWSTNEGPAAEIGSGAGAGIQLLMSP